MWAVGINQTLVLFLYPPPEAGGYGFSNLAAGLFYIAPMSAVICGELFGHFFSIPLIYDQADKRRLSGVLIYQTTSRYLRT